MPASPRAHGSNPQSLVAQLPCLTPDAGVGTSTRQIRSSSSLRSYTVGILSISRHTVEAAPHHACLLAVTYFCTQSQLTSPRQCKLHRALHGCCCCAPPPGDKSLLDPSNAREICFRPDLSCTTSELACQQCLQHLMTVGKFQWVPAPPEPVRAAPVPGDSP